MERFAAGECTPGPQQVSPPPGTPRRWRPEPRQCESSYPFVSSPWPRHLKPRSVENGPAVFNNTFALARTGYPLRTSEIHAVRPARICESLDNAISFRVIDDSDTWIAAAFEPGECVTTRWRCPLVGP